MEPRQRGRFANRPTRTSAVLLEPFGPYCGLCPRDEDPVVGVDDRRGVGVEKEVDAEENAVLDDIPDEEVITRWNIETLRKMCTYPLFR